jgi:hypothetical protein
VATVPASVTVAAGLASATFTVSTSAVSASTSATIKGSYNSTSQTGTLTVNPSGVPWWNSAWTNRVPITVQNTSSSAALPIRYSVKATLNTSSLITAGQMLANCADLVVIYFDGTTNHEIDRVINNCGTTSTDVWFALQRPIAAGAQDTGYDLYYGNPSAGTPPSNGMNVFLFYEDWENGASHWMSAGGLDPASTGVMGTSTIATSNSFSPTHSQQFTQMGSGGDAFSGFIPVNPNTGYAVLVWATSATGANFPVGFDPYDVNHVKGPETWLWTSGWTLSPQWTQNTASFTTSSGVAYIKLKDEWWIQGPGTAPVYSDNLALRYALSSEPTLTLGSQTTFP